MYKSLPSALPYAVLRGRYNPHYRNMFIRNIMKIAGYDDLTGYLPSIESFDKPLIFTLKAGETQTNSFQSNGENWVCVDRSATIILGDPTNPIPFSVPNNIKVSSWFSSADGTKVTVIEDGPINLLFGSGEWQHSSIFVERSDAINNRIWSLTNESEFPALATLNFKFIRVCRSTSVSKISKQVSN